jgi:hypothetical protein
MQRAGVNKLKNSYLVPVPLIYDYKGDIVEIILKYSIVITVMMRYPKRVNT